MPGASGYYKGGLTVSFSTSFLLYQFFSVCVSIFYFFTFSIAYVWRWELVRPKFCVCASIVWILEGESCVFGGVGRGTCVVWCECCKASERMNE